MSAKLVLRVEWNETVRTCRDPFDTKKFSNLSPEILVEWIAPQNSSLYKPSQPGPWETSYEWWPLFSEGPRAKTGLERVAEIEPKPETLKDTLTAKNSVVSS